MSEILDQLNDEMETPVVTFTDVDGVTRTLEFLDLVFLGDKEYLVLTDPQTDGDIEIYRVLPYTDGEAYRAVEDDATLLEVFDIFRRQHEDEFDFS